MLHLHSSCRERRMAIEGSVITTGVTILIILFGVWSPAGVYSICPHHCLKSLPTTDTCEMRGSAGNNVMKEVAPGSGESGGGDRGKPKRIGGLDNHGNCRVVDQGSLTYQFKLTETGEHCTKCSCEYGQPAGADPICKTEPHAECYKLGLTPVLRETSNNGGPPNNGQPPNNIRPPNNVRPPGQPQGDQPQGGQGQAQRPPPAEPDFDEDYEWENGSRPPSNPPNTQPDLPQGQGQGPQPPVDGFDPDYGFYGRPPNSNFQPDPDEFEIDLPPPQRPQRPPSNYPTDSNRFVQRPPSGNWGTGQEFEYDNQYQPQPQPPRRRPPNFAPNNQFVQRPQGSNSGTGQGYEYNGRPQPPRRRPPNFATGNNRFVQQPSGPNSGTGQEFQFNHRPQPQPQRRRPANFPTNNRFVQRPTLSNWASGQAQGQNHASNYQPLQTNRRPSGNHLYVQRPSSQNFGTNQGYEVDNRLPSRRPSKEKKFPYQLTNASQEFEFGGEFPPSSNSQEFEFGELPPSDVSNFEMDHNYSQNASTGQDSGSDPNLHPGLPEYEFKPPIDSNLPVEEAFPPTSNLVSDNELPKPADADSQLDYEEFLLKPIKPDANFINGPPLSDFDFEPFT